MKISDCKGCKVESVGHSVIARRDRSHELLCVNSRYDDDEYQRRTTEIKELSPLLFIQEWTCNNCGYISIRHEDGVQFHPIEPHGKDLDAKIPETIRKDFNEARLIAKDSPRCGNVLLRTCLEGLCNWIAEEFLEYDKKADYPKEKLNRKIEYLNKHTHFVSDRLLKKMNIIKEYGNDIHAHQKIDYSDTIESFNAMLRFIESICDKILLELKDIEVMNEYHQKISQKTKT